MCQVTGWKTPDLNVENRLISKLPCFLYFVRSIFPPLCFLWDHRCCSGAIVVYNVSCLPLGYRCAQQRAQIYAYPQNHQKMRMTFTAIVPTGTIFETHRLPYPRAKQHVDLDVADEPDGGVPTILIFVAHDASCASKAGCDPCAS